MGYAFCSNTQNAFFQSGLCSWKMLVRSGFETDILRNGYIFCRSKFARSYRRVRKIRFSLCYRHNGMGGGDGTAMLPFIFIFIFLTLFDYSFTTAVQPRKRHTNWPHIQWRSGEAECWVTSVHYGIWGTVKLWRAAHSLKATGVRYSAYPPSIPLIR